MIKRHQFSSHQTSFHKQSFSWIPFISILLVHYNLLACRVFKDCQQSCNQAADNVYIQPFSILSVLQTVDSNHGDAVRS